MQTMLATPEVLYNPLWYPNKGATKSSHHGFKKFGEQLPCYGTKQVYMGNSFGIPLRSVGYFSFLSPFDSSTLHLNPLMHVPNIIKNLMSVSRFAADQNLLLSAW